MSVYQIGEIVSLLFMAIALGMDAFSVSLGMGMQQVRLKRIALIGLIIGLFHIIMPFIGILLGQAISTQIGQFTTLIGGLLLVGIGAQMVFSAFNHDTKKIVQPVGIGLLFFAISVSLDSFSVGLSLGMSGVKTMIALMLFGIVSTVLTWAGMILGKKVHGLLGVYSEILGGSILCGFGLNILFG
ncbi:Putative Mn2+ efflux pump MntP [Virgibacillus subterraneus]|uniref:Putative manganese efflux pump MntP n=2 Tax=Virgibacillus TaxID=84406 RepID=A0A1H0YCL4_9BACI|nr:MULTISPECIES: manganese efflux pump MntP family protein [Virgibacillus]SDQ12989.1 Putative Mn2+ efflux pump MntP [Virgibacillus salinus]SEP72836.1 Putative Mn2+ efflux pump MntP [Virgibacillus subterraneus]